MSDNETVNPDATATPAPELPKRLSPSRIGDFVKCPYSFYNGSVLRLPKSPTEAQIKGTLVHSVLEHVFDEPRGERTVEAAFKLLPGCWAELRAEEAYTELVASLDEESFLSDVRQLVANYWLMEDPNNFDPAGREMWVRGNVGGQDLIGVIDRIDRVPRRDGDGTTVYISDYKTGKVPQPRYRDKAFFAMRMYALMRHQDGEKVDRLRLVYLKGASRDAVLRLDVDDKMIADTEAEVAKIVAEIHTCAETGNWPTIKGPLCNWCDYQSVCPEFAMPAPDPGEPLDTSVRIKAW